MMNNLILKLTIIAVLFIPQCSQKQDAVNVYIDTNLTLYDDGAIFKDESIIDGFSFKGGTLLLSINDRDEHEFNIVDMTDSHPNHSKVAFVNSSPFLYDQDESMYDFSLKLAYVAQNKQLNDPTWTIMLKEVLETYITQTLDEEMDIGLINVSNIVTADNIFAVIGFLGQRQISQTAFVAIFNDQGNILSCRLIPTLYETVAETSLFDDGHWMVRFMVAYPDFLSWKDILYFGQFDQINKTYCPVNLLQATEVASSNVNVNETFIISMMEPEGEKYTQATCFFNKQGNLIKRFYRITEITNPLDDKQAQPGPLRDDWNMEYSYLTLDHQLLIIREDRYSGSYEPIKNISLYNVETDWTMSLIYCQIFKTPYMDKLTYGSSVRPFSLKVDNDYLVSLIYLDAEQYSFGYTNDQLTDGVSYAKFDLEIGVWIEEDIIGLADELTQKIFSYFTHNEQVYFLSADSDDAYKHRANITFKLPTQVYTF